MTSCCFTHNLTSVTYQGPTVVGGQEALAPRGVLLFATTSIPPQASAFYWELELCLLAESSDAVSVAMGYSPIPPQQQGEGQQSWQYPHDTCLMRRSAFCSVVCGLIFTSMCVCVSVWVCMCVCLYGCGCGIALEEPAK